MLSVGTSILTCLSMYIYDALCRHIKPDLSLYIYDALCRHINPDLPAYDVLLDMYERGMTSDRLDSIFTSVRDGLIPLIEMLQSCPNPPSDALVKGRFDTEKQAELSKQVALDMGFCLNTGRMDVSVHPFTGGSHPTDVRITTRFKEDDLLEGLTGTVHEAGHALYEQVGLFDFLLTSS